MTTTQQYALILLSLEYISIGTPYSTAQLYAIYLSHKAQVDAIYNDPVQREAVFQEYQQYLGGIIITDPDAVWG